MADLSTPFPLVEHEMSAPDVANNTPAHTASGNESDSTDSVPDLIPASDIDSDTDESGQDVPMHRTILANAHTRAVNGMTNRLHAMSIHGPRQRQDSSGPAYHPRNNTRLPVTTNSQGQGNGTQHARPASNNIWRGPAYLAHRAFRDAVADRLNNGGFFNDHASGHAGGPAGANTHRRGGAPYQVHRARDLNGQMVYDLIRRLQRLERALQGLEDSEEYGLPRHM